MSDSQIKLFQAISMPYTLAGKTVDRVPNDQASKVVSDSSSSDDPSVRATASVFSQIYSSMADGEAKTKAIHDAGLGYTAALAAMPDDTDEDKAKRADFQKLSAAKTQASFDQLFKSQLAGVQIINKEESRLRDGWEQSKLPKLDDAALKVVCLLDKTRSHAARFSNVSGHAFHNCRIFYDVIADADTILDFRHSEQNRSNAAASAWDKDLLIGAPQSYFEYWQNNSQSYWDLMGSDVINLVYVPEFASGSDMEIVLAPNNASLRIVNSVQLTFVSDEGVLGSVTLSRDSLVNAKTNAPLTDEQAQHSSVHVSAGDGLLIYRFKAYSALWSEALLVPRNVKQVDVAFPANSHVTLETNGHAPRNITPGTIDCPPLSLLRFEASGTSPTDIAVRFLQRPPSEKEKAGFQLTDQNDGTARPTKDRIALRDALVARLEAENFRGNVGHVSRNGDDVTILARFGWNANSSIYGCWLCNNDNYDDRIYVVGRIIDNLTDPPALIMYQAKGFSNDPEPSTNAFSFHLSADGHSLEGTAYPSDAHPNSVNIKLSPN